MLILGPVPFGVARTDLVLHHLDLATTGPQLCVIRSCRCTRSPAPSFRDYLLLIYSRIRAESGCCMRWPERTDTYTNINMYIYIYIYIYYIMYIYIYISIYLTPKHPKGSPCIRREDLHVEMAAGCRKRQEAPGLILEARQRCLGFLCSPKLQAPTFRVHGHTQCLSDL